MAFALNDLILIPSSMIKLLRAESFLEKMLYNTKQLTVPIKNINEMRSFKMLILIFIQSGF